MIFFSVGIFSRGYNSLHFNDTKSYIFRNFQYTLEQNISYFQAPQTHISQDIWLPLPLQGSSYYFLALIVLHCSLCLEL